MNVDPSLWGSYAGTFADWEEEGAAMTTHPHQPPHAANLGVRCSLKTLCLYCGYPFGQGEHAYCLKRIRQLRFIEKPDQREMVRQVAYLGSKRYKNLWPHTCSRCGTVCRWRSRDCHAHTRAWIAFYGGVLSRSEARTSKTAVHRYKGNGRQGAVNAMG